MESVLVAVAFNALSVWLSKDNTWLNLALNTLSCTQSNHIISLDRGDLGMYGGSCSVRGLELVPVLLCCSGSCGLLGLRSLVSGTLGSLLLLVEGELMVNITCKNWLIDGFSVT